MADTNGTSTFTRGPLVAALLAVGIIVGVGIVIFFVNPTKVAEFSVAKEDLFAPHTELGAMQGSIHVLGQAPETEDDLYVVAHVRFTDKLRLGIILSTWTATATLADGSTIDATTVPPRELPRLEEIFPALTPLITQPISYGDEVNPGQTTEGSLVLLFPNTTQTVWKSKRSAVISINLRDQPPQSTPLP